jgi:outer membrane protein OmpA-like peptidoglycan-associated protein
MSKAFFLILICLFSDLALAQENKKSSKIDVNELISKMEELAQKERDTKRQTSGFGNANGSSSFSRNGNLLANYERLNDADKTQIKDLPIPPSIIRTAEQAQGLLDKLKGIELMKRMNETTSFAVKMYLVSYQNLQQNAQKIVKGALKAKSDFQKNNPNINYGDVKGRVYVCKNDLIYLPLGDISFADEVQSASYGSGKSAKLEQECLQIPDAVENPNRKDFKGVYSLGLGGSLVVKFTNNALIDVNGNDLYVFELGEIEPTNLEISTDGNQWLNVGKISGGVAGVDISNVAKPNEYYYYVRLTDLKSTSTVPGADIDAIAAIGGAMRMSLSAEVLFDFGKSELKQEGIEAVKKMASQLANIEKATVTILGYTDDIGTDFSNQKLSLTRAESVAKVLRESLNLNAQFVFKTSGLGKQNPVVPNTSDENRKKNRRVEILVSP